MAKNVSDHRPNNMEAELVLQDALLLRAVPRMDNMAGRQPPANDRHPDRDSDSRHDNNEPDTSMASFLETVLLENSTASGEQANGKVRHART